MRLLVAPAVLGAGLVGCATQPDGSAAASKPTAVSTATESPTPYPWSDCNALRPGDPLDFRDLQCNGDELQVLTMDCISGTYVHLIRPARIDLEGIDGITPTWREADPVDQTHGRTPWAFKNCQEHG